MSVVVPERLSVSMIDPCAVPPSAGPGSSVALRLAPLDRALPARRSSEPVTVGVPLPRAASADPERLSLVDRHGSPVALQVRVLDRWADGSIRWALLDFQVDVESPADTLTLRIGGESTPPARPAHSIACRHQAGIVEVATGTAVFRMQPGRGGLFASVIVDGLPVVVPERTGFLISRADGPCAVEFDSLAIEVAGPVRTVVCARGRALTPDGSPLVEVDVRCHYFAGSSTVRIVPTVRNPRRARHDGGFWELGDEGSVFLSDVAFCIGLAGDPSANAEARCSERHDQAANAVGLPFEIYQESSGGDHWDHPNHRNRHGVVPLRYRGYRVRAGRMESRGHRATPIVELRSGPRRVAVTLPQFWQNFPKAIEADAGELVVRLFPPQFDDGHELQGGEQKTHTFYVAFGPDGVTPTPLDWCRSPLRPTLPPEWYANARAVPFLRPRGKCSSDAYTSLIDAALDPAHGFAAKREVIDEYGWRHFGDLYADHEAVQAPGEPLVSHYNNQYDAVAGFARQFWATGDPRWWELMDDLARHVVDIDLYRTSEDKAAYNGGLFWHTSHYVDAGLSTHRAFPKSPQVWGGGPSNEHNYGTGLMLHYFLTGDPLMRDAVMTLARWVVEMDDGSRTVLRWITRGATGLASQTRSTVYHGPGRGAANSIRALLDGHRLSGDAALLSKAEELVRRVVHPRDDIDALNLLDAEQRWSYTVCLQAIAGYLDYKAELGEVDVMYDYARQSLLHYASWMARHERPYLDAADRLEHPTETWVAQDIRKSDVLYVAAQYSGGEQRRGFLERAAYFFTVSVDTLTRMPTRTFTRPVVILLSNGTLHEADSAGAIGERHRPDQPATTFGRPARFVPQKERAKRRLILVAAGAVGTLGAVAALLLL